MPKPSITSLSNPLIKQVRALRQKKTRQESGLFLVEGIHHVGEALQAGWEVESILYAPELLSSDFGHLLIEQNPGHVQPVSRTVMEGLADKDHPQGILAIVHQRQADLNEFTALRQAVALVAPQDPGNLGTILRTMDAVGCEALFLLDGGVELYHPTVIRASMGTLFWIPIIQISFDEFFHWSRNAVEGSLQLVGTSAHGTVDSREFTPDEPWVLVLGNEQKGLTPEQVAACDITISLPMKGRVSSLNLAVAAGVLLYQFHKNT